MLPRSFRASSAFDVYDDSGYDRKSAKRLMERENNHINQRVLLKIVTIRFVCFALVISLLSGCNLNSRNGTDNTAQTGNNVVTSVNVPVTIDIVPRALEKRSTAASGNVVVSIESGPRNGSIQVLDDNKIVYTPSVDFHGQDTFVYKISDLNGPFELGTISVGIICEYCTPGGETITLSWNPIPDNSLVYMIYYGHTPTDVNTLTSETSQSRVELNIVADLGAQAGDTLCFRLRARNNTGISGFSAPVCMVA